MIDFAKLENITRRKFCEIALTALGSLYVGGCRKKQDVWHSELENQIFEYVDNLSYRIPTEFVKRDFVFHDHSLIVPGWFNPLELDGKGRIVYNWTRADYGNYVFAGLFDGGSNSTQGKPKYFFMKVKAPIGRLEDIFDEAIILSEKDDAIIYLKKEDLWKKCSCMFDLGGTLGDAMYEYVSKNGKMVPLQQVQRYVDLAGRLEETYFDYEALENRVYDSVIKSFPEGTVKEFVSKQNPTFKVYHELTVEINVDEEDEMGPVPYIRKGRGRMVTKGRGHKLEYMMAIKAEQNDGFPPGILFGRILPFDESLKGKFGKAVFIGSDTGFIYYAKKDNIWKKGYSSEVMDLTELLYAVQNGKVVPAERVQKYLDLANHFENAYFKQKIK